jgi:hypothetical protein
MKTTKLLAIAALALGSLSFSCGPSDDRPKTAARREVGPQWQDVFDGVPEVYAIIRPQAIKRDAVYGQFFKSLVRVAQVKTSMKGVTSLEAFEGCDEIIIGIRKDPNGGAEDAAMIFRGVPASLDATKMTDSTGHNMLRLIDAKAKVPEYDWVDRQSTASGSLFVLPDRTWVGAMGEARARARSAFATPFGRPAPKADPEALASVRFDAAAFLTPTVEKSGLVGPMTRKLRAITLALKPGKGGVVASLHYADEDASAFAEMHLRRVIEELSHRERAPLDWLKTAQVGHDGNAVIVKVAIPTRLLEDLPNASANDLPL